MKTGAMVMTVLGPTYIPLLCLLAVYAVFIIGCEQVRF